MLIVAANDNQKALMNEYSRVTGSRLAEPDQFEMRHSLPGCNRGYGGPIRRRMRPRTLAKRSILDGRQDAFVASISSKNP